MANKAIQPLWNSPLAFYRVSFYNLIMSIANSSIKTHPIASWLSPIELSTLHRYIQEIRSLYGDRIHQIILFGSRARGGGNEESDLDVAVIVTACDPVLRRRLYDMATELWLDSEIKISPLVLSEEEFLSYLKMKRGIALTIQEEGIPL